LEAVDSLLARFDGPVVLVDLEDEVFGEELAVEPSDNYDLVLTELAHSSSLAGRNRIIERSAGNVNLLPRVVVVRERDMQAFDRRRVLLGLVLDATENVNEFVIAVRARVVVAAFVYFRQLHPLIDVRVIHLHAISSGVHFLTRARYQNVPVEHGAAGMAVTSELHHLLVHELEVVVARVLLRD